MRTHYENEVVRIADLTVTTDVIQGASFRNCLIIGPAILAPLGETAITNSVFPGPAGVIFWVIEQGRDHVLGVVGLDDCMIEECSFERVGFAGPEEMRASFPSAPVGS